MENGPATRTRASIKQDKNEVENISLNIEAQEESLFKTPIKTQIRRKRSTSNSRSRSRTPSGQVVSSSVKDIRNFFGHGKLLSPRGVIRPENDTETELNSQSSQQQSSQLDCTLQTRSRPRSRVTDHDNNSKSGNNGTKDLVSQGAGKSVSNAIKPLQGNNIQESVESHSLAKAFERQLRVNMEDPNQRDEVQLWNNHDGGVQLLENKLLRLKEKKAQQIKKIYKRREERDQEAKHKRQAQQTDKTDEQEMRQTLETEFAVSENAAVSQGSKAVDIHLVMQMFKELKKEIGHDKIEDGATRVSSLEERNDSLELKLLETREDLAASQLQNSLMCGVMKQMCDKMEGMNDRISKLEYNAMKKSVVLTGLHTTSKKEDCIEELYKFMDEEMGVQGVEIEDIFFMNRESTSPMIINFVSQEDKKMVMENVINLKGLKNEQGKPFT